MSIAITTSTPALQRLNAVVWESLPDGLIAHCDAGQPRGRPQPVTCSYLSVNGRWTALHGPPAPLQQSYDARALQPDYRHHSTRRVLLLTSTSAALRAAALNYYGERR